MQGKEEKGQNIVAYITNLDHFKLVVDYATAMVRIFDKPLAVLYISDPKYPKVEKNLVDEVFKKVEQLSTIFDLQVSYHYREGKTAAILESDKLLSDTVCIVASVDKKQKHTAEAPSEILKICKNLRMAYLLVQAHTSTELKFERIALSVDFEREAKEKTTWASFFGRFCHSTIYIFHYKYRDEYLRQKLNNNLIFLKKMFENVAINNYSIHTIEKSSRFLDLATLQHAAKAEANLLIALSTKQKDLFDYLSGTMESRTIVNDSKIPVLLLNSREDLYVICN